MLLLEGSMGDRPRHFQTTVAELFAAGANAPDLMRKCRAASAAQRQNMGLKRAISTSASMRPTIIATQRIARAAGGSMP